MSRQVWTSVRFFVYELRSPWLQGIDRINHGRAEVIYKL
jgi:hypothetical protein